ncbi:TetR/AcrR family transcriptional regulator [Gordonia soli]|uniref:Putative TetR family transcriptional regulator n=1 Tax=Gordonia soli NBRC 108243 TaxID=1223545 RepID=M0QI18_9ACTN|nr:TetR/AcrR family transcriptional regulator [Gordonia soli]GAC68275.1 putative TetR family transcriptional regulator [Gordonia soli NBRC 108243]
MPSTPNTRPGGRTAAVRAAVLDATENALIEDGFAGMDLPAIARAAGVGKTTVYRRWGTPQVLVADLLDQMAGQSVPATRTGDLLADLQANAELVVDTLADPRQGRLFAALIAAATHDRSTRAALDDFYRTRVDEWSQCLADAVDRGDAPTDTDAAEVIRHLSAPLYYRFLTTSSAPTRADAQRSVRATVAALRAGVFADSG